MTEEDFYPAPIDIAILKTLTYGCYHEFIPVDNEKLGEICLNPSPIEEFDFSNIDMKALSEYWTVKDGK